jgi:hypothetical protein
MNRQPVRPSSFDGSRIIQSLSRCPDPGTGMPDAKTHEQKFEAMVDDVKKATVLIIGY